MKVLLSWLREFVDAPGTAEDIAAAMSLRGFAVEGLEQLADGDTVIDFEITANRPDCMSVMGVAREVATACGLQVRRPVVGPTTPDAERASASALRLASLKTLDEGRQPIPITIEDPDLCPRYAGATADVAVGPSPGWMQGRLRAAGVRPISNIVDITNYVLLELGQPMHAFDASRLRGGEIRVRTARSGESLRTLDGERRELTPDMLVIADAEHPVALAGVMGGADSEVAGSTTTILLESACFNPRSVRRTSRALALKTEASMRFERGTDPRLPVTAMERACALLATTASGSAHGTLVDCYPRRAEPSVLRLRRERIAGLLGASIPDADVRRLLESLGFALREAEGGWHVTVPTRRVDILREVDLIEEVARHYGFDRIATTFPALTAAPPRIDPRIVRTRQLRSLLTGAGFSEAVTFGFVAAAAAAPFGHDGGIVPIANPLSENFAVLRPSVLPGLIDAVSHNRRREQRDIRLFEIGARFSTAGGEVRAIGCAWCGAVGGDHWSGGTRPVDFFDMKGVVERICRAFRLEPRIEPVREPWLVAGRSAAVLAGERPIGVLGQLAGDITERHGLPPSDAVMVAELDLDALEAAAAGSALRVEALPRYPSVTRDISVLVDETLAAEAVRRTVRAAAPSTLARVREFDRYQGKGIPDGKVSLSLRLTFRSPERTLTEADVHDALERVLASLRDEHGARQR
jgi:phenylalanyl-tRNA synthetase beta chain